MLTSNVAIWREKDLVSLAGALLRYSHGDEYSDAELDSILALSNLNEAQYAYLEDNFMASHLVYVKSKCIPELAKLQLSTESPIGDTLNRIFWLWKRCVLPDNLHELNVLSAKSQEQLQTVFGAMARHYLDISEIITWLSNTQSLHYLQEVCKVGLDAEANAALATIIPRRIDKYITETWKLKYAPNVFREVELWVKTNLIPDVKRVIALQAGEQSKLPVAQIMEIATTFLANLRINELYDIVKDSNSSGLEDLAVSLVGRPDLRESTAREFTLQCRKRLLNGASDTVDIIQMLLLTVQSFSILDPQGVLLEKVSAPIRQTLKYRSDTSVNLAEGLFGDPKSPLSFLYDELRKQAEPRTNETILKSFETWVPDPIDTPADFVKKQTQDNVTTLIDLYDNKEVFVKQFLKLFCDELLNKPFDIKSTVSHLRQLFTLLSARFGHSNMQNIAVMLEDVQRSDILNEQIHQLPQNLSNLDLSAVSPVILSRLYWPGFSSRNAGSDLVPRVLPKRFRSYLEEYTRIFRLQPGYEEMDLRWLPDKGKIQIELELADRTLDMVVEPFEAILISAFSEDAAWGDADGKGANMAGERAVGSLTLTELAKRTNLEESHLLTAIQFWVDSAVLGTDGETYRVLETSEEADEQRKEPNKAVASLDGPQPGSSKQSRDMVDEMNIYWSYIVGMLTNLGSLPLEKIHSFLVMFVPSDDPYVKTKQELETYLFAMVDESKLQFEDGKFSLPKR